MSAEIRICLDAAGQYQLQPLRDGAAVQVYIPDLLKEQDGDLTYVIEDPQTFQELAQTLGSGKLLRGMGSILQNMQRMRLCVWKSSDTIETREEHMNTSAGKTEDLFRVWLKALKAIPAGHRLCEVQLDFGALSHTELRGAAELFREARLELQRKATQPVHIVAVNCSDAEKAYLEGQ